MKSVQTRWFVMALTAASLPSVARAEIWGEVARGFELFGYQFSGEKNVFGDGFTINANTVYAGREFDFGLAELTLGSQTVPTPSNFQFSFTRRGLPKAEFTWNTGGVAMPYTLQFNNGIQDIQTVNGNFLADVSTDINVLGFYDTRILISNRGEYSTDGFLGDNQGSLDFDLGPIDISGNIYADILATLTQPLWDAAGQENPFAKFSSKAAKEAKALEFMSAVEELQARLAAGEVLSDAEMSTLINSMIANAVLTGGTADLSVFDDIIAQNSQPKTTSEARTLLVPEPTVGMMLFGVVGPMVLRRSRRR